MRRDKIIARRLRAKLHLAAEVARVTLNRAETIQRAMRRSLTANRSAFSTLFHNARGQQGPVFSSQQNLDQFGWALREIEQQRSGRVHLAATTKKYLAAVIRCYKMQARRRTVLLRRVAA